jgi:hypothetical protein
VKRKLRTLYEDKLGDDDLIPAHILGSWINKRKFSNKYSP